jgi:TolB protein
LIAFSSDRSGNYEIYTMDTNGQQVNQVTSSRGDDQYPTWGLNGDHIAYISNEDGVAHIFAVNPNGSGGGQLTFGDNEDWAPVWWVQPRQP